MTTLREAIDAEIHADPTFAALMAEESSEEIDRSTLQALYRTLGLNEAGKAMIAETPRPLSRASQAFDSFLRRLALSPADESELRHHVTAWACTYANAARRGALLQIATQIAGEPTIREAVDLARRAAYAHEEDT